MLLAVLAAMALLSMIALPARAGITVPAPQRGDAQHAIGAGLSYGVQLERYARFWGWTIDGTRHLGPDWSLATSLTWDRETETFDDRPDTEIDTYTWILVIGRNFGSSFTVTTGVAKGIADSDNPRRKVEFNSGDWSTGLALGYALGGPFRTDRQGLQLSGSLEYNLSRNEPSISFDLGWNWSF